MDPRLPGWAQPRYPVLVLTVIAAVILEPEQPCTVAAPCGPDWVGMIQVGLAVVQLLWYVRLPELTLVSGPVLAVIVAVQEFPLPDTASDVANAAVIAALAFGWAASWQRLALRRRQRCLAEQAAAGVRQPLPEGIGPLRRGIVPIVAGLVLCVVAGVTTGLGLWGIHEDEQRAAKAVSVSAVVLGKTEETLRVRTSDGSKRTVSAFFPEDYDTGSVVTLLSDGDWIRLAAEPYDAFGWQLLTLAAGLPGLTFLAAGVLARRRAAALRRGPVPLLRVLQRLDHNGDTWVYAADDTAGSKPLLRCLTYPVIDDEAGEFGPPDDGDEDRPRVDTRLREAVLYGPPHDAGELVIVAALDGDWAVMLTAGPVRLPPGGQGPELEWLVEDAVEQPDPVLVGRIATSMRAVARPVRWGPSVFTRCAALLGAVTAAAVIKFVLDEVRAGTLGWHVLPMLGLAFVPGALATFLNWRITADRSGLWLAGAYKVRHLTWDELRAVVYTGGVVEIRRADGKTWAPSLGWPWMERRMRLRPSYVRAVEEISAMHSHPELRPTEESPERDHGLPLGPVLAMLYALWAAALLIL
ncbi:hypothetical protein [Streptomyces mirabilis]|uniref:hypothetical protein n=1 Tax=Streptomyces mirabilis TaxID=68239 RepID=UPI00331E62F6